MILQSKDSVTVSLPRIILTDIVQLSSELIDRMDALLERNTDGQLSSAEKEELETLVRIAEFGQIIAMALQAPSRP